MANFSSGKELRRYIFRPSELQQFLGFAQTTQKTGFLLGHVLGSPEGLAVAVMKTSRHRSFKYILRCAIPAFFGYFASQEHLNIAVRFYRRLAESAPRSVVISALRPLLRSAVTFRFVEHALTRVVDALVAGLDQEASDSAWSAFLGEAVRDAIPLLPEPILGLFRLLRERDWDEGSLQKLLFEQFLWPVAVAWLRDSPAAQHESAATGFFARMLESESHSIFERLFSCTSQYEVPALYDPFRIQFLDFYVSIRDVHVIARMLDRWGMMPDTVTLDELRRGFPEGDWYCYPCQVYTSLVPTYTTGANAPAVEVSWLRRARAMSLSVWCRRACTSGN